MASVFEGVTFDKDFILKKELKSLGFRETDIKDSYYRFQDEVHAELTDIFDDEFEENKRIVRDWKEEVKSLLSKPLLPKYRHRKRPHRSLLPKMDTGELRDSVKVILRETPSREWSYELKVNFKSKHAELTNLNITRRGQNKRNVAWYGWADRMLTGNGLKNVISARNLMRSLFR